jgi:hypothetical protein
MTKCFLFIFIVLFVAFEAKSQVKIQFSRLADENLIESGLLSEIKFTELQLEKLGMISPDMELKYENDNYFILDNRFTQCVYRFDEDGVLLNSVCEKTPGDTINKLILKNPVKFNVNPFLKQVEIYNFENSSVQRFSYDGTYQDKIKFSINPADFIRDRDGNYFIYTGWNNKESQFRLLQTDKNGNVTDRKMRLVSKCTPTEGMSFYYATKGICMWELLGNSTYMISKGNVTEKFTFDFGTKSLLPNYHELDASDSYQLINHTGYYTIKKYLENDNFAYFFLNFTSSESKQMIHIIYDKKTNKTYKLLENSGIGAFDKAQALTENDELIFLIAPRKFRQILSSENESFSPVFSELADSISSLRNTVVLRIKLQSTDISNDNIQMEQTQDSNN